MGFEADGIDINDAGEIVANPYEGPRTAFVYVPSGYFVLPALPGAPQFAPRLASAISNAGSPPEGRSRAVFWCKARAPIITNVKARPNVLWPPNHKMVRVRVDYSVTTSCGATATTSLSVGIKDSDHGHGEGDFSGDAVVVDEHTVLLRAERSGDGHGRTYTIWIRAVDSAGLESTEAVTVRVPKNVHRKDDEAAMLHIRLAATVRRSAR